MYTPDGLDLPVNVKPNISNPLIPDKVRMYEEIVTNDDNLESNLLTSSSLKKTSGLHAGTSLTMFKLIIQWEENDSCSLNLLAITVYTEV